MFSITLSNENIVFVVIYLIIYYLLATIICLTYFKYNQKQKLDDTINDVKSKLLGITGLLIYFLMSNLRLIPLEFLNIDYNEMNMALKIIYVLFYEAVIAFLLIFLFRKVLKRNVQELKKEGHSLFKKCFKYYIISLIVMMISNLLISILFTNGIAENEELVRTQFKISPLYIFISAVIPAPILEELTFRQSMRSIFKNKWLFIVASGLLFGGMHVFPIEKNLLELLYLIPYSAPGIAFAYMLVKTDNVLVPMSFHLFHNGIMISLQFLLLFFS
jgi:membrane protease YdiL (CAAX protease family)